MRIEKLGAVIAVGIGSAETTIRVTPDQFELNGAPRCRAEIEELRDALIAALAEYDAMTTTTEPAASPFMVGQMLTGDEDLPTGTVVRDSDRNGSDTWTNEGNQWVTADGDHVSAQHWPGTVKHYGPVTIVSLP